MINTLFQHTMPVDNTPLICRFGAFGDMILVTPLIKRIYQRTGMRADILGLSPWTSDLYKNSPYVRNIYTINSRKKPYYFCRSQQNLVKYLRGHPYSMIWICEVKPQSYKILERGNIEIDKTVNALSIPAKTGEHYVDYWLRISEHTPGGAMLPPSPLIDESNRDTELFVTDEEIVDCLKFLETRQIDPQKPLVCIQPGNKRTMRHGRPDRKTNTKFWPLENWSSLANHVLTTLPGSQILLLGVSAEKELSERIRSQARQNQRVFNLAGELPIRRLLSIFKLAHSTISVDTGPAHAAAAMNCPLTVLFGKADPRVFAPVSNNSPVEIVTGRIPGTHIGPTREDWAAVHDIKNISVQQVISHWEKATYHIENNS